MKFIHRLLIFFLVLISSVKVTFSTETISAIGHHDYAPWNWEHNGKYIGAAVEVSEVLFKRLGIEVDATFIGPWKRGQEYIRRGHADLVVCGFINEDRKSYSEFIMTPMGFIEQAIFVKKGKEFEFNSWKDLRSKKIGLALGVSIGQEFDTFLKKNTIVERRRNYEILFNMLNHERIDAVAIGRYSGRAILETLNLQNDIVDLNKPILTGNLYIFMSKKSKYLHTLPKIEKFIQEDGYYEWVEELLNKYTKIYAETSAKK